MHGEQLPTVTHASLCPQTKQAGQHGNSLTWADFSRRKTASLFSVSTNCWPTWLFHLDKQTYLRSKALPRETAPPDGQACNARGVGSPSPWASELAQRPVFLPFFFLLLWSISTATFFLPTGCCPQVLTKGPPGTRGTMATPLLRGPPLRACGCFPRAPQAFPPGRLAQRSFPFRPRPSPGTSQARCL